MKDIFEIGRFREGDTYINTLGQWRKKVLFVGEKYAIIENTWFDVNSMDWVTDVTTVDNTRSSFFTVLSGSVLVENRDEEKMLMKKTMEL